MARSRRSQCAALAILAALGRADAQHIFGDGFEESCLVDSDSDRLANCQEVAQATDYNDSDTDDDGLSDGDEVLGTIDGLNLPGFGVNPKRRDILIEYDWQDDNVDPTSCSFHSHKPDPTSIEQLRQAFADAPLLNPDGSTGINLIQDVGQGGHLSGGNFISVAGATVQGALGQYFQSYKSANFAPNRLGYFHYVINTHAYTGGTPGSSGVAEIFGDDIIVSLGCSSSQDMIRNTIMHELGHNIGLLHGGDSNCNRKPNYNSVMNYRWQFSGIDTNCDGVGNGVMAYSTGARQPLDENHLNEVTGMCGTPIDWNPFDGGLFTDIAKDVNTYTTSNPTSRQIADCGGLLTVLMDHDDWRAIDLQVLPGGAGGGEQVPSIDSDCDPPPSGE